MTFLKLHSIQRGMGFCSFHRNVSFETFYDELFRHVACRPGASFPSSWSPSCIFLQIVGGKMSYCVLLDAENGKELGNRTGTNKKRLFVERYIALNKV
jgi:hypothetical protein